MLLRRRRLGFRLGSDLVPNLLQGADTRREGVSVVIDYAPRFPWFPFESGGLFIGEFEAHPPRYRAACVVGNLQTITVGQHYAVITPVEHHGDFEVAEVLVNGVTPLRRGM